ncbi:hypothetical protein Nstercoris_01941 [Nitrosomonas stercoris]|uniref:Zinc resistance-associated protein n=1 Tax=Nitrosomonas stercoris TaxID=1444684 RepID=A0A4Y1YNF5_9PROT|nr:hypothetical protein Nstercoris_01941 [Nitrosomonas stercoris]
MNTNLVAIIFALALPLTAVANSGEYQKDHTHYQATKIERMGKHLSLTDEQKTKLEALFKQNREKFKALREESRTQMQSILTPEQYSKLQETKQQRREKWRAKHHKKHHQEKSGDTQ